MTEPERPRQRGVRRKVVGAKPTLNRSPLKTRKAPSAGSPTVPVLSENRDGGILNRDPLNPIRLRDSTIYDNLSAFIGEPGVGAVVSPRICQKMLEETGTETGTAPGTSRPAM